MTYEKIAKHQAFVTEKGQALKDSDFDFNRSTTRTKRLMQLNNMVMENLVELNAQTMSEAFAGESIGVTIQLDPEDVERVEKFRADAIQFNSVHGTRDSAEWFRQMEFDRLAQICFRTLLAKSPLNGVGRMNILSKHVDSIVIMKKEPGRLVEAESENEVIVIISNDEVVLHNDYEMKTVPVTEINN